MKQNQQSTNGIYILKFAIISCLAATSLVAQEEALPQEEAALQGESREQITKRLVDLGPGIHERKEDSAGKLKSVKVVGSARISKVLGAAKGLQIAQTKAKLSAQQAFIEWLNTNVSSVVVSEEETIVTLTGDGEKTAEEAKGSEKTTNVTQSQADGLIRGLSLVGKDVDAEGETLTLIYIWSPARAAQAIEAAKTNAGESGSGPGSKPSVKNNEIKSKTAVSPDFDE